MKIKAFAQLLALPLLLGLACAQAAGQSASGTYQFSFEDGYTKYLEFSARKQSDGTASGSIFLSDEATLIYGDVDGDGTPSEKYAGFYIKADVDGMVVDKNQAVMSGTITESDVRSLVGQRVLLTVEDNGDGTRLPDQLTWGIYKPVRRDWIPSDAELKEDPGVGATWYATDAERKDDVGYKMPRDESITVNSFPVASYAFATIDRGAGDIVVSQ